MNKTPAHTALIEATDATIQLARDLQHEAKMIQQMPRLDGVEIPAALVEEARAIRAAASELFERTMTHRRNVLATMLRRRG